jgi:hypothetical protein
LGRFVHDPADSVTDVLLDSRISISLNMLLHSEGDFRPPAAARYFHNRQFQRFPRCLNQALQLGANIADWKRRRGVGTPAIELACGVDFEDVAALKFARPGYAVNNLLVDGQARARRKWNFDRLDTVVLEQWNCAVSSIKIFDGLIDIDRLDAGLSHFADEVMGRGHDLARLAHKAALARGFEFRSIFEEFAEHAEPAYSGIRATIRR